MVNLKLIGRKQSWNKEGTIQVFDGGTVERTKKNPSGWP
jgi:hypothetical protein